MARIYRTATYTFRANPSVGDRLVPGWGKWAPGELRGYDVKTLDGSAYTRSTGYTVDDVIAAQEYYRGGVDNPVTSSQETAITASSVGGTFHTV